MKHMEMPHCIKKIYDYLKYVTFPSIETPYFFSVPKRADLKAVIGTNSLPPSLFQPNHPEIYAEMALTWGSAKKSSFSPCKTWSKII